MRTSLTIAITILAAAMQSMAEEPQENDMPTPSAAPDMLGKRLPLEALRFIDDETRANAIDNGKAKLVRWWTDTCPYCEGSLPAIQKLEEEFGERGFETIAVYHPKPPREVANRDVLNAAKRFGYAGILAVDDDWAVLRRAYLDTGRRSATSVSFLLDGEGRIRYVHPGPELRPGAGKEEAELQAQYDQMRMAIDSLLAESERD